MAQTKLNGDQRATLLEWIAADYDAALILQWAAELDWPKLTRQAIHYYRQSRGESVKRLRSERYTKALDSGLAQKSERVARLKRHADSLEAIKWVPDKNGRLWNEKAWRETLRDIAEEMGERKPNVNVEINIGQELKRKAEDAGIDIRSDPILLALFTALGISSDGATTNRSVDGGADERGDGVA